MDTPFSAALREMRKRQGFPTAYKFFHTNGGKETFGFTYRQYLRMEQGKSLPECVKLYKMMLALRLVPKTYPANALAIAWLKTHIGAPAYDWIFQFIPERDLKTRLPPIYDAMKNSLSAKTHYLSRRQDEAIHADLETLLCWVALSADSGAWSAAELAKTLELPPEAAERALRNLASVKLLKTAGKGKYRCPLTHMMLESPNQGNSSSGAGAKWQQYRSTLLSTRKYLWFRDGIIRADEEAFRNFIPIMKLLLSTAESYKITRKTSKSALFYVESRIAKLRDF